MKQLRLAFLAALLGCAPAAAAPAAGDIAGTWECRQPGVQYNNKPPILYVSDTPAAGGGPSEIAIEVDGFAREVYGRAGLTQDPGGWWKVKPAQGQEFLIRPETGAKRRTPAMGLRWADSKSDYRCLRLPASPAANRPLSPPSPGAENAPGTLSVPPAEGQSPGPGYEKKE
jgi:hypothetical protein